MAPKEKKPDVRPLKLFERRPRLDGRIAWANLLARVSEVDVTKCGRCGGQLRLVETVSSHKGLTELQAARGPARARAAVVEQLQLFGGR